MSISDIRGYSLLAECKCGLVSNVCTACSKYETQFDHSTSLNSNNMAESLPQVKSDSLS